MGKLFGTDGVRGIANKELTCELAYSLGKAGAYVLTSETKHKPKILVGMDTRISGDMLENALIAGLCSAGAQAICVGVIPTPAIAHLTRIYSADAGVMISASHNPYEFNGIKFFNGKGNKLADEVEEKIEDYILNNMDKIPELIGKDLGTRELSNTASIDYINFLKSTTTNLNALKIVLDCANGSAYKIAPLVFNELGADIVVINNSPNGININDNCGSTHIEKLKEHVLNHKADIGLAFDGDADRVLAMDEKGNVVDGDKIMAIIGINLKNNNKLNSNTIVSTVMSNLGLDITCKNENLSLVKTNVGDRYVLEEMIKNNYSLGGEQSGHIILLDYNTTGDGILTGLKLANIMKSNNSSLSSLASVMNILPQVLLNAKVNNKLKNNFSKDQVILSACEDIKKQLNGEGRVLIRPSGTEPLIRVMIEGKELDYINTKAIEMVQLIENRLN